MVIMNIMLVSVTERTREIGVRKALGAKQRDVLMQFLIESASLASVGGIFGILVGVLVGKLITVFVGFPTAVPIWAIFLGLFLASAVGHIFRGISGEQSGQTGSGGGAAGGDVKAASLPAVSSLLLSWSRSVAIRYKSHQSF